MGAKTFEDLIAWQKARALAAAISKVTKEHPFAKDRILVYQILRAVRGIGANIAKGSASEVRAHLYHALDDALITEAHFTALKLQAEEVSKILYGLRAALLQQRKRD